jgi:hypothetical protein
MAPNINWHAYLGDDRGEYHPEDIHSKALSLECGSSTLLISLDFCVVALIECLLRSEIVLRICPSAASSLRKSCHQALPSSHFFFVK